jgi:hypothetical protein
MPQIQLFTHNVAGCIFLLFRNNILSLNYSILIKPRSFSFQAQSSFQLMNVKRRVTFKLSLLFHCATFYRSPININSRCEQFTKKSLENVTR